MIDRFTPQLLETCLVVLFNPGISEEGIRFCKLQLACYIKQDFNRFVILTEFIFMLYFDRSSFVCVSL